MRRIVLGLALLTGSWLPAHAAVINFNSPGFANGNFDVQITATNVFAGRDTTTDALISYGFNVTVNPALLTFNGATSGALFDAATTEPGTNVFGAASGFGVTDPVIEPLDIVTLHFTRVGAGSAQIQITSDLKNLFQGLQFLNDPIAESIANTITVGDASGVPEPGSLALLGLGLAGLVAARRRK